MSLCAETTPMTVEPDNPPGSTASHDPTSFDRMYDSRGNRALADAFGWTQGGVNQTTLTPGTLSARRHGHGRDDAFLYGLRGRATLVTGDSEESLRPSMAAWFPVDRADGHHVINRGDVETTTVEVSTQIGTDGMHYPDDDLQLANGQFHPNDGTPH